MADFPDSNKSGFSFSMPKVDKLTPPSEYQSTSGTSSFAMPTGFSTASAATATPNIAYGASTPTLGYADKPQTKNVIDGQDPLKDVRASCWQPNIISSVEQPTYHIRFYITEDKPLPLSNYKTYAEYYKDLQSLKQTTIAESGVTGLTITGLTIDTLAAPNSVTRSMSATNITLSIVEPMGVSFFDMIAEAAAELQISNFTKMYYFIDVKFIGYEDGLANMNVCKDQGFDNGGIWTYQVRIGDVQVDSNSAASNYTFTAMPFNEHIYNSTDLKLPAVFQPQGATVGEMLSNLADTLNKNELRLYGYPLRTFKFRTTPCRIDGAAVDPSTWSVTPSDIELNYERAMAMGSIEFYDSKAPVKGTFPAGANINDVIETIIVSSREGKLYAKDVQTEDKTTKDDGKPRRCLIFRYEPTIEVTAYDEITCQYMEAITFDILSYVTMQAVVEQADVTAAQANSTEATKMQQDQAISLTSAGYMCKRYDYMFTGLNTEVLNFDFKYNFPFEVTLPKLYGYQNSHASYADHAKMRGDRQDIIAIQEQNRKAVEQLNNLTKLKAKYEQDQQLAQQTLAKNPKDTDAQSKLATAQASLKTINDASSNASSTLDSNTNVIGKLRKQYGLDKDLSSSRVDVNRTQLKYAEDILGAPDIPRYPVATKQSGDDPRNSVTGQIPESYTRDRAIYGAILDQLYLPVAESLLHITLSIKGDPYWLGTGNVERSISRSQAVLNGTVRDHFAPSALSNKSVDYSYGDILFLLTFKYPLSVGDDGAPVIKSNESFTGIYRVISIKHEFHDGQFKQEVTAVRCPLMDAFKALGVKVIEIPANDSAASHQGDSNINQTVTSQVQQTAAAKAGNTGNTTTTASTNQSTIPVPDAPAYSPLKPPLPPGMSA